jgi:endonuclease-3
MKFYDELISHYKQAEIALEYKDAWELLVATILSAQCTDIRVNQVTKLLFKKYHSIKEYAEVDREELEKDVKSTGFFRSKARAIQESARMIIDEYDGQVPDSMEELLKLRGVARKTANVVLGEYFKKHEGIVVDTHVKRIAYRLGWTKNKDPNKVEQDLMKKVPKKDWALISFVLIDHGRALCKAPNPTCSKCFLQGCPKKGVVKQN